MRKRGNVPLAAGAGDTVLNAHGFPVFGFPCLAARGPSGKNADGIEGLFGRLPGALHLDIAGCDGVPAGPGRLRVSHVA